MRSMARMLKRTGAIIMIMSLLLLMFECIPGEAKTKIGTKKVTIEVGEKYTVKLKGLAENKTAEWTISKTKVLKQVKTTRDSIKIKGKKAGTSYVTAKVGTKTYKCKIKVTAKPEKHKTVVRSFDTFDSFAGEVAGLVKNNPVKADRGIAANDRFATARLLIKSKTGTLKLDRFSPADAIKGSDNIYVVQFETSAKAQEAFAEICALDDVEWAEPDAIIGTNIDLYIPENLDGSVHEYPDPNETDNTDPLNPTLPGWDDWGFPDFGYPDPGKDPIGNDPGVEDPLDGFPDYDFPIYDVPDTGNTDEYLSWGVTKLGADAFAKTLGSGSITVAVVDTGVAYHDFLSGRIVSGYDYIDNDTDPTDLNSHGTHVAGTIVDCTPGLNVYVMPVRVLGADGSGTNTTVGLGIRYAADYGAKVVNLSLGGSHSNYLDESVKYAINKGVTVCVAAGNEYSDTVYSCPAHMTESIVVGAVDMYDTKADFSNIGDSLDVVAPGVGITSCVLNGQYDTYDGTSMATPHISAISAMLMLKYPDSTPARIESLIKSSARDLGSVGWDKYYGYGMPDLSKVSDIVIEPTGIRIEPAELSLDVGGSTRLSAYISPSNATDLSVYWSSSDPGVASIDTNGHVTAISQGNAIIYARTGNLLSASCPVVVSAGYTATPTPYPTTEPTPTWMPYPTTTPLPTLTPYPTTTPLPTLTPYPTTTPVPTQPVPTQPVPTQPVPTQPVPTPNPGPGEGSGNGFTYRASGNGIEITGYTGSSSSVVIPKELDGFTVVGIGMSAFSQKTWITDVKVEADASIGMSAFSQCTSLRTVEFAGYISSVGMSSFAQCSSLTEIKITGTVPEIGMSAFVQCGSLKTLTLNSSVRTIGMGAFTQCPNLSVINYCGTVDDWSRISIGMGNEQLEYAVLRLC
ncbi:MAG: S8 family serine peptidase [Lachnospiraceae bacterium]|nr:S8 family serine peptidase [Lachnospiraceae bacterium]